MFLTKEFIVLKHIKILRKTSCKASGIHKTPNKIFDEYLDNIYTPWRIKKNVHLVIVTLSYVKFLKLHNSRRACFTYGCFPSHSLIKDNNFLLAFKLNNPANPSFTRLV